MDSLTDANSSKNSIAFRKFHCDLSTERPTSEKSLVILMGFLNISEYSISLID